MARKLLTKVLAKTIPALYATDGLSEAEKTVPVKFFDPCGRGTWFVVEFDGEDTLFCWCVSPLGPDCDEFGYASLAELSALRNRLGLPLERDEWWNPETTLEKAKAS